MQTEPAVLYLPELLNHLAGGGKADRNQIKFLLSLSHDEEIERLFKTAREVRRKHFGDRVFLYGFLYFSTFCRNNCRFCQYRQANHALSRYRKNESEILAAAREMADTGVHLIDLTMGEDPELFADGDRGFERLADICRKVQQETGLPVMISPGVMPDHALKMLADAGVTWYACYQETHTRSLYNRLRPGQDFDERMLRKRTARKLGMLIEEGLLTGVGESVDDLATSMEMMADLDAHQVRVMTFVPQKGTPMVDVPPSENLKELIIIAVMRLLFPDRLIPASLDVDGLDGLKARLDAGANVITSIVPPQKGLAGVAHNSLDIEDARRTHDSIVPILTSCGLTVAEVGEYRSWIEK
ncbi:BioB2 [Desulforapulum autotrophicum HRM2]|uniref:BioB2 n=1 Tax=Desulforapulum autotrophicum (strain ATCC 43914 / DSM 3382 / VKM B-1955 / HRM2) TaxID=177437 RepID=C0Q9R9_DESAH|nr:methylornithine synthase PylB [Desulforapulum autotrophicum]ACN14633.1 BioB2 [Desulforapulum autotrophicum HRM2]